jgi:glycosyltransferase involved in cell wall biosynthesis
VQFYILHIIESLDRGGAELLFINYINNLPAPFKNIIVYLRPQHTLKDEIADYEEVYCLNYSSIKDIPRVVLKLANIIKRHNVELIHSHLYWPTIVARLAAAVGKCPLVFSVHNTMTDDAFNVNVLSKYLEKMTYSTKQSAVFVSEAALEDYKKCIPLGGKQKVIYNFIRDAFFSEQAKKACFSVGELKLVAVGNLRAQKNISFLVSVVGELQHLPISLDIYGEGPLKQQLHDYVESNDISNVRIMGSHPSPETFLRHYDAFVLLPLYEGFCLAMVEAMAVGLPCIISDIEVLKEVSGSSQIYVNPANKDALTEKILLLYKNPELLSLYSKKARKIATKYTKESHLAALTQLYKNLLEKSNG